jgi:MAF protein
VDENPLPGESPQAYVLRLAEAKARAAWQRWAGEFIEGTIFLGADTTVALDGDTLGKPDSPADARRMLALLRDRAHQVWTGLALVRHPDGNLTRDACISQVSMRPYSDDEMSAYISSGDPLDKAGAYAIQHTGFQPVLAVNGCYANVVGLPVCRLGALLRATGDPRLSLPSGKAIWQNCQEATSVPCQVYQSVLGSVSAPHG